MSEKESPFLSNTFRELDSFKEKSYEEPFVIDWEIRDEFKGHIDLFLEHAERITELLEEIRMGKARWTIKEKNEDEEIIKDSHYSLEIPSCGIEYNLLEEIEDEMFSFYRKWREEWLIKKQDLDDTHTSIFDKEVLKNDMLWTYLSRFYEGWYGYKPWLQPTWKKKAAVKNLLRIYNSFARWTDSKFMDKTLFQKKRKWTVHFHKVDTVSSIHDIVREIFWDLSLEELKEQIPNYSVSPMQVLVLRKWKHLPFWEYVTPYVIKGQIVGLPFRVNKRSPRLEYGTPINDFRYWYNDWRKKTPSWEWYRSWYRELLDFLQRWTDEEHLLWKVWDKGKMSIDEHHIKKWTTLLLLDEQPLSPGEEDFMNNSRNYDPTA